MVLGLAHQIRKLIAAVTKHGSNNGDGTWAIKFGDLFTATEHSMEALAGTLKTALKHGVVKYEAEMLFQGQHDDVVISLLKTEIADATADTCASGSHAPASQSQHRSVQR